MKKILLIIVISILFISCKTKGEYDELTDDYTGINYFYDLNIDTKGMTKEEARDEADRVITKFEVTDFKRDYQNKIIKTIELKKAGVKSLYEFRVTDDNIILLDMEDNNIKIIDFKGNLLKTIGKLGSGENEFKEPTAFYYDEKTKEYYLIDLGNNRIVITNDEFKFKNTIDIKNILDRSVFTNLFCSIIKYDGDIYISPAFGDDVLMKIFRIDKSGDIFEYQQYFGGFLEIIDDRLCAIESMRGVCYGIKNSNYVYNIRRTPSLKVNCYDIDGDEMKRRFKLPSGYWITDMLILDNKYYMVSASFGCLDEFELKDNELKYIRSLTPQIKAQRDMNFKRFRMQEHNGNIILSDYGTNKIYIVEIKNR